MHPDQFIAHLRHCFGLSDLAFNDDQVCRLVLDDEYVIDLEWVEGSGALYVYSVVHTRASELEHRLGELLASNLFGHGTGDATLALDPEYDEILLTRRFELLQLDLDWFSRQLEHFAQGVCAWTAKLSQHHHFAGDESAEELSEAMGSALLRV